MEVRNKKIILLTSCLYSAHHHLGIYFFCFCLIGLSYPSFYPFYQAFLLVQFVLLVQPVRQINQVRRDINTMSVNN